MAAKDRSLFGVKNARAKLNEKDVGQIRTMLAAGLPQAKIAKAFNVGQMQISRINTGAQWKARD